MSAGPGISCPNLRLLGVTPRLAWMLPLYSMTAVLTPERKLVSPSCLKLFTRPYRVRWNRSRGLAWWFS